MLVGTSSIVVPVVLIGIAPRRFRPRLAQLTTSINAHSNEMAIVIVAVLGAYLTFRGVSGQM